MSWDQLEGVLVGMAATPERQLMARHLLQGARREVRECTAEATLREILFIAAAVAVETAEPDPC